MPNHIVLLKRLHACREAENWYDGQESYTAWRTCSRADWLLWIAGRIGVDRKLIVSAACDCAATALRFVLEGESRPREAIAIARRWVDGTATIDEVRTAANAAADAANAANAAADAALYAANAAANAAADAALYAANAAANAAADAIDAANAANVDAEQLAFVVRRRIPWRLVRDAIIALERE